MQNPSMTSCIFCGLATPDNREFCHICHKPLRAAKSASSSTGVKSTALGFAKSVFKVWNEIPLILKIVLPVIVIGGLLMVAAGVVFLALKKSETSLPAVFSSYDTRVQIVLPAGWEEDRNLFYNAQVQASDQERDLHLVITSVREENKYYLPSDLSLDKHLQRSPSFFEEDSCAEMTSPVALRIKGYAALQHELRAIYLGQEVRCLHTSVETPAAFHEITLWTRLTAFDKNRVAFQKLAAGFDEFDVNKQYTVDYHVVIQESKSGTMKFIRFVTDKRTIKVTMRDTLRDTAYVGGMRASYGIDTRNLPETISINGMKFTITDKSIRSEDCRWALQESKTITIDLDKLTSHYSRNSKSGRADQEDG
jgi:hypothetical protein